MKAIRVVEGIVRKVRIAGSLRLCACGKKAEQQDGTTLYQTFDCRMKCIFMIHKYVGFNVLEYLIGLMVASIT